MDENTIFQNPKVFVPSQQEVPSPLPESELPQDMQAQSPNRNILKFIIALITVAVLVFLFVKMVIPGLQKPKETQVTLSYWGLWESPSVMQSVITKFEKENPNIKISYAVQDVKQYRERLGTRIKNGTGPDIFSFHNTWLPMLSSDLLPLPKETLTKEDFTKWFYPVAGNDLIKNGAIYGIPVGIDTLSLYVNTTLFEGANLQPPTTWVDFANYAKRLTIKDAGNKITTSGAALGTFNNITHAPDIVSLLFAQNGVNLYDIPKTSQAASEALIFYTAFAMGNSNIWDSTLDQSMLAFAKGNLAMYFGYSWDFFAIKAINPNLAFAIYPVPHLGSQNMTIASYWANGVSVKSSHQKEALLFIKFLAKKETEEKLFTEESKTRFFGQPYARTDLADSLKTNTFVYPFILQAKDAVSSFFVDSTYDNGLNSKMNAYLGKAVESVLGNTSPQTAVDALSQGVTQVLKQYGQ
ncbi:MAG: extracellular solute-binding protein [Candidatus Levybacteria bacterium]|nr:extracellular solute-binding protein [Candidatus Levybacteria bacterium]